MADKETKTIEEENSKILDLKSAEFTEPDVTKSVAEAQRAPRIIGKLMTLLILVPLMIIVGILIIKDKGLIGKTSSFIGKMSASRKKQDKVMAVFSWEKRPEQHGLNPEIRKSLPQETVIMKNDDRVLIFYVYYHHKGIKEVSIFEGEKASGKIKGTWSQVYPLDGGEWHLYPDPVDDRLFTGEYSDRSGDWIPIKLQIKLN